MVLCTTFRRPVAAAALSALLTAGAAASSPRWEAGSLLAGSTSSLSPTAVSLLGGLTPAAMKLGSWRGYTRQALLPDFGGRLGFSYEIDLGLLANHEHLLLPGFALHMAPEPATRLTLDLERASVRHSPFIGGPDRHRAAGGLAIDRVLFSSGVRQQLSEDAAVDVAAVFANQRFGSWGMGSWEAPGVRDHLQTGTGLHHADPALQEATAGTGLRFGFLGNLASGVSLDVGFQSRIEMDAFQYYRGVYSEPGDFDIPASANVGMVLRASERASVYVDVQRVLYSEINAFTTAALPDRFLSLLGDAGSPEFQWRDLTVYSLGWNYAASANTELRLQYSTRQQPTPTSEVLYRALASEMADSNFLVGLSQRTGQNARVDFNASYAPTDYFLGPVNLGRSPDSGGDQFEFELRLVWEF